MDLSERSNGTRRHPWEAARARFFRRVIADHVDLSAVRRVLDVGAGDGWFAEQLSDDLPASATVMCFDVNYTLDDLRGEHDHGDARGAARVVRTAMRPAGTFDVVVALDVLEHVAEDEAFLGTEIVPAIAPGGTAVLSVPAHTWLFSDHDRMLEHVRRYPPADFRALVGGQLEIVASGSLFTTLVPPRAVSVLAERLGRSGDGDGVGAWQHGRAVTKLVTAVLDADAAMGRRLARRGLAPPGLSTWVVATRAPATVGA
jgi:trans-aconitate methyltransferase